VEGNHAVQKCFDRLIDGVLIEDYEFSPLAKILNSGHPPRFEPWKHVDVLSAPTLPEARELLRERNKEWLERWKKVEEQILDPERELPPFSVVKDCLWFEGLPGSFSLENVKNLRLVLKDERLVWMAYSLLAFRENVILDVQWKKIGDPGVLLMTLPDDTPVLLNLRYGLKFLPKGIRTVSEAILDGKKEP
jgi:hypothetical protein